MEAALINLLEPGDTVVIGRAGFFAHRMVDIAQPTARRQDRRRRRRLGLSRSTYEQLIAGRAEPSAAGAGAWSTARRRPASSSRCDGLADACREVDAMLVVDAVATLGGVPLAVDELGIDVCYSGSQKCLSAPPGLAPITLSDRALQAIEAATTPGAELVPRSGAARALLGHRAHLSPHRAGAERLCAARGVAAGRRRGTRRAHARGTSCTPRALRAGLEALGLRLFADPAHRLTSGHDRARAARASPLPRCARCCSTSSTSRSAAAWASTPTACGASASWDTRRSART